MITFMHRALICTTTVVESTRIKISDSKLRNIKIKKDLQQEIWALTLKSYDVKLHRSKSIIKSFNKMRTSKERILDYSEDILSMREESRVVFLTTQK